jgi:D-amino-acid oxidase
MESPKHVVVVGAGFMGLTAAVRLLEAGYKVTVVAEKFVGITSISAPSAFRPGFYKGGTPKETWLRWGKRSLEEFTRIYRLEGTKAGLTLLTTLEPYRTDLFKEVGGKEVLAEVCGESFRPASAAEKEIYCPKDGYQWDAITYTNYTIEGAKFLPYLRKRIESMGGSFVQERVSGTPQSHDWCADAVRIAGQPHSRVVVNCCGLDGGEETEGLRGTLVLVKAPWLRFAVCNYDTADKSKPTWIVPRENHVMLGTSKFPGGKDRATENEEEETSKDIIERCAQFVPALRKAPIIATITCVRPNRSGGPCVEHIQAGDFHVMNNYGHSTVGGTFSWGCAEDVVSFVNDVYRKQTRAENLLRVSAPASTPNQPMSRL